MIIQSAIDNDLYKFSMQQVAFHSFNETVVKSKFVCRSKNVDLRPLRKEIEAAIDHFCSLRFTQDDIDYLREQGEASGKYFSEGYLSFLLNFRFKRECILVYESPAGVEISISGTWLDTILFEVPILAIVSETHCTKLLDPKEAEAIGMAKLMDNIELLKHYPIKLSDFGTRRRYSFAWHKKVLETYIQHLPKTTFSSTSNVHLARLLGLKPAGTMAHEFLQLGQGIPGVQLKDSQKHMLEVWAKEYRGKLGIALTDTIGIDAFLKDFDGYLARLYDGVRHDSGNPYIWADKIIAHYKSLGIDPLTKTLVFTDGLDIPKAVALAKYCEGKCKVAFGIGTKTTNDFDMALSIVIKLIYVNAYPVAKISDEPEKAICMSIHALNTIKWVYGLKELS